MHVSAGECERLRGRDIGLRVIQISAAAARKAVDVASAIEQNRPVVQERRSMIGALLAHIG